MDSATRGYITRKLEREERHLPDIRLANVLIRHESTRRPDQRFSAQITLAVRNTVLRSQERAATATAAIDVAADVLDRRARQYKTHSALGEWAKHSGASIRYAASDGARTIKRQWSRLEALRLKAAKAAKRWEYPARPIAFDPMTYTTTPESYQARRYHEAQSRFEASMRRYHVAKGSYLGQYQPEDLDREWHGKYNSGRGRKP